jgi:hypothetical protein
VARSLVNDGVFSLKIGPNDFVQERQFFNNYKLSGTLPVALSFKMFGISLFAARLPMILYLFGLR